jgi:hypothetical protein
MGGSNGEIMVALRLASRTGNPSGPYDNYKIETVKVIGKKTQILYVNEVIVPETIIIATFSDPKLELGHTLSIEIRVRKINSSSKAEGSFSYNIDMLRESSGKIYHTDKLDDFKQEPGFEIFLAFSAIIIAIAVRRKKE